MTDPAVPATGAVADPKRPYKAYVAVAVAVAITVTQVILELITDGQTWTTEDTIVTILAFLGAVSVYVVGNPIVPDPNRNVIRH